MPINTVDTHICVCEYLSIGIMQDHRPTVLNRNVGLTTTTVTLSACDSGSFTRSHSIRPVLIANWPVGTVLAAQPRAGGGCPCEGAFGSLGSHPPGPRITTWSTQLRTYSVLLIFTSLKSISGLSEPPRDSNLCRRVYYWGTDVLDLSATADDNVGLTMLISHVKPGH